MILIVLVFSLKHASICNIWMQNHLVYSNMSKKEKKIKLKTPYMRAVNSNKNILHTQLAANSFVQHLMTTNEFVIRMCLYKFEYEYFVR